MLNLLFQIITFFVLLFFVLNNFSFFFRFFLEMSHNQKSTKLEWTIIILIGAEIVIGICGHIIPHFNLGIPHNLKFTMNNNNNNDNNNDNVMLRIKIIIIVIIIILLMIMIFGALMAMRLKPLIPLRSYSLLCLGRNFYTTVYIFHLFLYLIIYLIILFIFIYCYFMMPLLQDDIS